MTLQVMPDKDNMNFFEEHVNEIVSPPKRRGEFFFFHMPQQHNQYEKRKKDRIKDYEVCAVFVAAITVDGLVWRYHGLKITEMV